jgi:MSHA biogenesis protein MshP
MCRKAQSGFSLIAAIFLLVVLALMGTLIVSITGMQSASGQLDLSGVRAYQAARAGTEWAAYRVLDPENALNPASCSPVVMPTCPAASTNLPALGGTLSSFTVTVTCAQAADTTESNRNVRVFQIVATACNQPSSGSCPNNTSPTSGYVERRLEATFSKCKDSTASAPRCSCG